jgi:nicotinate-nucleotide pyrophosphorylase (carboxylating)
MRPVQYRAQIEAWLREDLGRAGDLTSAAIVDPHQVADADLVARVGGVIAGLDIALEIFRTLDADLTINQTVTDGQVVEAGTVLVKLSGNALALLGAERTALNLLGRLSGIATATRAVTDAVAGTGAVVADTRKTTPGLRMFEKHAVRMGGGANHRFGLDDAVMIKDNHVALAGSVTAAVKAARARVGHIVKIEVEVDTLEQLDELLRNPVDIVLLDNMTPDELRHAVAMVDGRMVTEASGGITIDTAAEVASTGVDILSVGWLTHSATNLDVALDVNYDSST